MAQFKKATFKSLASDEKGGGFAKSNEGYEFTAFAVDGKVFKMYVAQQEDDVWRVIDPMSGLSLCTGSTRKEAVDKAAEPSTVMYFSNMLKSEKYTKMCDRFLDLVSGGKAEPKPKAKPKATPKAKAKTAKKPAAKPKAEPKPKTAAKPKAEPKLESELLEALKRIEELERKLADLKTVESEKATEKTTEEATEKAATEWTIESVRKWAVARGFVAEQVNPERKDCIWVYGVRKDDKATQKELTGMGFRWGRKGWYVDPKRARK